MTKNTKGLTFGREECQGKNYLKPTVASRQANRPKVGLPPLHTDPSRRGQTAPTWQDNRSNLLGSRAQPRNALYGSKGFDSTKDGAVTQYNGVKGMTLQDYAAGGGWCKSGFGDGPTNSTAGTDPRKATAPCWRKSR